MTDFVTVVLLVLSLAFVFLPLAAIGCLLASLRHRLPGIDIGWAIKSRFSKYNFTPRGQALRRWGGYLLLLWVMAIVASVILQQIVPREVLAAAQARLRRK